MSAIKKFININKKELLWLIVMSFFISVVSSIYSSYVITNWIKEHGVTSAFSGLDVIINGQLADVNISFIYPVILGIIILCTISKRERYNYLTKYKQRMDFVIDNILIALIFLILTFFESLIIGIIYVSFNCKNMVNFNMDSSYFSKKTEVLLTNESALFLFISFVILCMLKIFMEINVIQLIYTIISNRVVTVFLFIIIQNVIFMLLEKTGLIGNVEYKNYLNSTQPKDLMIIMAITMVVIILNSILYKNKDIKVK